jgi:AcrR family transcriptional regulator
MPSTAAARAGAPAEGRELRARGQRTVRRLLDAGLEVFAKRGYHAARVDDIVKVARTSHGTFYLYFASKDDLFRALALDVADAMESLVGELGELTPDDDGRARLRAWLARFAELHRRFGPVIRVWTEAEIDSTDVGRLGTDVLGQMSIAFSRRIADVPGLRVDPEIAALALVAMIERLSFFVLSGQVAATEDETIDTLAEVTFAALFGAP